MDLYLILRWEDTRLSNSALNESLDLSEPHLVQKIWKPEVYFPNSKGGNFQFVTVPNVLIRIGPAGVITYMLR